MIPIKDFNADYEGCGCCQVSYFVLMDYVIIHLKNITPVGMWYDIGEYAFNEYDIIAPFSYLTITHIVSSMLMLSPNTLWSRI